MSLVDGLLIRTGTITPRAQTGSSDRGNNPTWEDGDGVEAQFYLEQANQSELTIGRTTEQATHLLILPADAVISGVDLFTDDEGNDYEVDGPPQAAHDPFGSVDVIDHLEVSLKAVGT